MRFTVGDYLRSTRQAGAVLIFVCVIGVFDFSEASTGVGTALFVGNPNSAKSGFPNSAPPVLIFNEPRAKQLGSSVPEHLMLALKQNSPVAQPVNSHRKAAREFTEIEWHSAAAGKCWFSRECFSLLHEPRSDLAFSEIGAGSAGIYEHQTEIQFFAAQDVVAQPKVFDANLRAMAGKEFLTRQIEGIASLVWPVCL